MKNRTRRHVTYKNDNFVVFFSLLLELSPLLVFEFDFLSLLCNTNTLRNIDDAWYKFRIGQDDVLRIRMTTLAICGMGGWGGGGGHLLFFFLRNLF